MTITRIQHQDIDFKKWDQTILSSATPFVFAQSFYLNATCPQWDALIIGDYESVFPLTHKTKFGFTYLPQPPFTSQLGVFGKVNLEIEQLFFKYITQHYKLIDVELNISNKIASEFITPKNTYILNYQSEYKFNQNTKRNINKAIENGLIVERVEDKDVISLSQKYLNPFLEGEVNLTKATVALLDDLLKNSIESKTLYTFKVLDKNQMIKAMGHFICNGKHALYLKGTNFDKVDNSGSMHLLMKYAIEFLADKSTFFDFGGGSKQGLANFSRLIKFIKNKK
ncbi:MAG: hypothetical protein IPH32_07995 [Bacteroidetes bacterium]|nr:hypothetical protein [Bacteroidota bacterium]